MSALSNCLKDILVQYYGGKQTALADKTSLPHSLISRYCAGGFRPNREKLDQICAGHHPDVRARIAVAHLHDECPPSARSFVRIEPSSDTGFVLSDGQSQDFGDAFSMLDRSTRTALEFLARIALSDKNAQEALLSTAKFLGAKF